MKKFLMALLLVLCMAFPAMADIVTVTTTDGMKAARTSFDNGVLGNNVTIVVSGEVSLDKKSYGGYGPEHVPDCGLYVSSDRTLTLQINKDCGLSFGDAWFIINKGTLTIKGEGSLSATHNGGSASTVRVYDGTVNISGDVSIMAEAVSGIGYAIEVFGGAVSVADNVSLTGTSTTHEGCGVCVDLDCTGTVNILSAKYISGSGPYPLSVRNYGDSLTVYGGTFSDNVVSGDWLGADCTGSGTNPYTVTSHAKETFNPVSLSLDITNGAASNSIDVTLAASDDVSQKCTSFDILDVVPAKDGVTASVDKSTGKITFTAPANCTPGSYGFTVTCYGKCSDDKYRLQTKTFTVEVTNTPTPTPVSSGSSGGCNAGFSALALAALAVIAAKQRKK